jgi:methionine synthase I (cobalamin-dependent)
MGSELVARGVRWRDHGMLTDADAVRTLYAVRATVIGGCCGTTPDTIAAVVKALGTR